MDTIPAPRPKLGFWSAIWLILQLLFFGFRLPLLAFIIAAALFFYGFIHIDGYAIIKMDESSSRSRIVIHSGAIGRRQVACEGLPAAKLKGREPRDEYEMRGLVEYELCKLSAVQNKGFLETITEGR